MEENMGFRPKRSQKPQTELGILITKIRQENNLSQAELGNIIGVKGIYIYGIENRGMLSINAKYIKLMEKNNLAGEKLIRELKGVSFDKHIAGRKSRVPDSELGKITFGIRKISNLTQSEFANLLQISESSVVQVETGIRKFLGGKFFRSLNSVFPNENFWNVFRKPIKLKQVKLKRESKTHLGKVILNARTAMEISQIQLALKLGFSQRFLAQIEIGSMVPNLYHSLYPKLSKELNINLDYLRSVALKDKLNLKAGRVGGNYLQSFGCWLVACRLKKRLKQSNLSMGTNLTVFILSKLENNKANNPKIYFDRLEQALNVKIPKKFRFV